MKKKIVLYCNLCYASTFGCYTAYFKDYPSVTTWENSGWKTFQNAKKALQVCLQIDYDRGLPLPKMCSVEGYPIEVFIKVRE